MKKTVLAVILALALGLCGCSMAEPTVKGHVKLPPRTTAESEAVDPAFFDREEIPASPEPVEIDISHFAYVEDSGVRERPGGAEIYLPGTYKLSGFSNDFVLEIDLLDDEAPVVLIFDGVHISSDLVAPIYIPRCSNCVIQLAEGSENTVLGGKTPNAADVNAAIWSTGNLSIYGGNLSVEGSLDNAVASKDILRLFDANIHVLAPDDGLAGRDALIADNSRISARVGGDGLKATNLESGKLLLRGSELDLTAGLDGVDGATYLYMQNCRANVLSGGGHSAVEMKVDDVPRVYDPLKPSYKGLKALGDVVLEGCRINADSADDCVHSDGDMTVKSCDLKLKSSDDGIHANKALTIENTEVDISYCYEGLEGSSVILRDFSGEIRAFDDGVNASASGGEFEFDGGDLYMVCAGDGIDSNGSIKIFDGNLAINGPTPDYNSVLDFKLDHGCFIYGGRYVSTGASGMALVPEKTDSAIVLSAVFSQQIPAGIAVTVKDSQGEVLVHFVPEKAWQNFQFSVPELELGKNVSLYLDGDFVAEVKLDSTVTKVNNIKLR